MKAFRLSNRALLLSATAFQAVIAMPAAAQDATPAPSASAAQGSATADSPDDGALSQGQVEEIIVTGIRASLDSATNAKRSEVTFGDSIFAEDIGKLPATNIAETLNRIPGVRLNRDITGEGTQVAIRGLGPSFTRVLVNGSPVNVASDGGTNGGSTNREVDLDLFPSELFTRLDVVKSPLPSQVEGGIAGVVNMRNARPFDKPGAHLTVVGQGQYTDSNGKFSPRGAIVASKTFGDTFGILVGVAGVKAKTRVDGWESVGWTDGNYACSTTSSCNATDDDGNGFSYASVAPSNLGHGYTAGDALDLTQTSGLTADQLSLAKIPRLGRNSVQQGTRSRYSGLVSMEWRPSDKLHFALDGMYAWSQRDFTHYTMNWYVRNSGPGSSYTSTGGMVPFDLTVDDDNVVTSGTFANSSFFSDVDIFKQTTKFWNVTPSMTWDVADKLTFTAQGNFSKSHFFREQPSFIIQTPAQSGISVDYSNSGGDFPTITPSVDLADTSLGWQWYRLNVQAVKRETTTNGGRFDMKYGDDTFSVKFGGSYDYAFRSIKAYDASAAYQAAVCGSDCGYTGTGLIPNSDLSQYLTTLNVSDFAHLSSTNPGYTSFTIADIKKIMKATNYKSYLKNAPEATSSVTGGGVGDIGEKVTAGFLEFNGDTDILGGEFRVVGGVRFAHTEQMVSGPITVGSSTVEQTITSSYDNWLPSINMTWDALPNLKLRFSASRSMTRANPGDLLPGLTFSDPAAQSASAGNPDLKPYTSDNIDFGGEYYTGGIGYVGLAFFHKMINGFTLTQQTTETFSDLGVDYDSLTVTQQAALTDRAAATGTAVADLPIYVNQPVNLQSLQINGLEATWVQPLDFLVDGLGFSANVTRIKQSSDSGLYAPGVAPWSYNLQGFYEGHGVSVSLNYVWTDQFVLINAPYYINDWGVYQDSRGQFDLSVGYDLPGMDNRVHLTLDALNLTNAAIRATNGQDGNTNATYSVYYPGRQVLFGIRADF
ncbi:TonB-dependent receptor [Novosphingobium sp. 1949]|uniref:TonB-dependent receptor n=1 Tax=Novosphingobium organovorum TaxID=2930092 RepID=A0ABT0BGX1_9SPHN|nr:TonB-dependent receptor [Novosphingobium organovorum]MCJ2184317.1 TonB-dependent receptor [Novosphingobium organovorum]